MLFFICEIQTLNYIDWDKTWHAFFSGLNKTENNKIIALQHLYILSDRLLSENARVAKTFVPYCISKIHFKSIFYELIIFLKQIYSNLFFF
jgi:hypothetical protein